jgi:hypothetical protein
MFLQIMNTVTQLAQQDGQVHASYHGSRSGTDRTLF